MEEEAKKRKRRDINQKEAAIWGKKKKHLPANH